MDFTSFEKEELMLKGFHFIAIILLSLLISCSSVSVVTDYDHAEDFSTYKTFRMYEGKTIPGDELAKDPLVKKRFEDAVKEELIKKGFTYKESGDVDFMVVIHAGVKEKVRVTNWGRYGWYDPWWGPYGGRVDVSQYEEGTLVIDIVTVSQKELAWRGMGTSVIGSNKYGGDEEGLKNIREIVSKILAGFPPK